MKQRIQNEDLATGSERGRIEGLYWKTFISRSTWLYPGLFSIPYLSRKFGRKREFFFENAKQDATLTLTKEDASVKVVLKTCKDGLKCQSWNTNYPHKVTTKPDDYIDGHNYCRNPTGDEKGPWCYTLGNKLWDYCDITECKESLKEWLTVSFPW